MKNTLLLDFILALSQEERDSAEKWLAAPLHNRREDSLGLYKILLTQPLSSEQPPTRHRVYALLYPGEAYDDQRFRLQCSYLLQCLESWLHWYEWQQDSCQDDYLLLAYRKRGLAKHYQRYERRHRKKLEESPWRHHRYHWWNYQLEEAHYGYLSNAGAQRQLNFAEQEQALQCMLMSHKLRLACLNIAYQRVGGATQEIALLDEVLALAAQPSYQQYPAIAVYYFAYRMYQDVEDEAAFSAFETLLARHLSAFPIQEGRDLILLGINFCIRKINQQGSLVQLKRTLALYRQGLDFGLLLENGYLTPSTFSNITIIALRSGEVAWAAQFLEQYREQLEPQRSVAIYALNAARLAYHEGNFRDALLLLHQAADKDFKHQLNAKIIQLKIYYETGDHQLLAAHIKNTRAYLRRVKRDSYHKQIYTNIFSLTDQLLKLPPYDHEKRETLRQLITNTEPLTEREWLLDQL